MWRQKSIFETLAKWLLPQACLLCGRASEAAVCPACQADLPRLSSPRCPRCALPLPIHAPLCAACLKKPPPFSAAQAAFHYAFPLDRLIVALKFGPQPMASRLAIADFLACEMLAGPPPAGEMLVPVPLSRTRLKERGFNQAWELARGLSSGTHLPLLDAGLERVRETLPQSRLPFTERKKNLRHAFVCRRRLPGARVILVDDVMTSGATLSAAAEALLSAGAAEVTCWVAARAGHRES